jgi:hypothetical protein
LLSTFTVDHLADDMMGQGQSGSLRYCITNATDGDDIQFSVSGTIQLVGQLPHLTHSISIEGPGPDQLTVRGETGGHYRIFTVDTGTTVGMAGLTISNGHNFGGYGGISNGGTLTLTDCTVSGNGAFDGGGILNGGTLTLTDCTVSGNSAYLGGGINNFGTATLTDCTVSGNFGIIGLMVPAGGGIFNGGTLTLTDCTVSANSSYGGGGIFNGGTATLTDCTVSGNTNGGGIFNGGTATLTDCTVSGNTNSGGIFNGGTATLTDCTVSGNSATGPQLAGGITEIAANFNATVLLLNCTIANNTVSSSNRTGSQIYSGSYGATAQVWLRNTILAGDGQRPNLFADTGGIFTSQSHNLSSDDGSGFLTGDGDLINTDPMLAPLGDYGGPAKTHALLPGSPALNAGDPNQLGTTDQRGVVRTGGVNIGAYQASASAFVLSAPNTVQSSLPFDVTVTAVDPFGQVAVGYTGTVTFSTSDTDPGVVLPADYAFTLNDAGVHTFTDTGLGEITLVTPGEQTLTVADTTDDTINGNATITVMGGNVPWTHDRFWTDLAPSVVSADRRR